MRWLGSETSLTGRRAFTRKCIRVRRSDVLEAVPGRTAPVPTSDLNPESLVGAGWDPDGLLPSPTSLIGGHFARREHERQAKASTQHHAHISRTVISQSNGAAADAVRALPSIFHGLPALQPISPEHQAKGGIWGGDTDLFDHAALRAQLRQNHMPVDLDFPGLRILHLDPFVCTVDSFWSAQQCETFIQNAEESGQLKASQVGAGNANVATLNALNNRRTSTSMLLDSAMEAAHPRLADGVAQLRNSAWKLLCKNSAEGWGHSGKLPAPSQYCFESLQVARYTSGQYFLSHEDAFPLRQAATNRFQRHATLLLYLNTVSCGGATRFDHLGVSIQPKQGMALLFFPAFSDGTPDARTLHTAMDAADTKWIVQQWIARGYAPLASEILGAQHRPNVPSNTDVLLRQPTGSPLRSLGSFDAEKQVKRRVKSKRSKSKGFGG